MCCFITPQIKFRNPASAVMYYKAQMGGREREERERKKRQREGGEQPGRPIQLAESVPVFASEGTRYGRAVR